MANPNSYDFTLGVRNVQPAFDLLVAKYPTLLSKIRRGAPARATKEEWLEDSLTAQSTTIASFDTDGDGTGVNVASTSGMVAGQLLRFTSSAHADRGEIVKIASVDSATDLTVIRDYGASVGVTLVVGDIVYSVSKPQAEGSTGTATDNTEPSSNYNYTQIFERMATITRTAAQVQQYGGANTLAYQIEKKMTEIMMEINSQIIYGERVQRSGSQNGSFGGMIAFTRSGNIDTTGGAISKTIINNLIEKVWADGAMASKFLLVCAENQARKISAFNTAGTNPVVMTSPDSRTTGGYVAQFQGDLPVQNGFVAEILVEPSFPKDKVLLLDLNSVELAYLQDFVTKDATPPGADYVSQRVLGELTLRVQNGTKAHGIATGLTI
jgi:hypothetical protein